MKTTTKIIMLLVALGALTMNAKAQTTSTGKTADGIRYSVGLGSGLGVGSFHNSYDWNLGGSLQVDIPVASQLYLTGNAGYNNFFAKDKNSVSGPDLKLIPAKAGIKYFPVSNLYVQGEAGAAFVVNKAAIGLDRTAAFIYAPQVGVLIPLSGSNALDAGVRYERSTDLDKSVSNSKLNYFGLRVAYAFGL